MAQSGSLSGVAAAVLLVAATAATACTSPVKLLWKYEIPAASVSTPLVGQDFVAFGSEVGLTVLGKEGKLKCFFDPHGGVISSPRSDGKRIFFGSTNYLFYAIDPSCNLVWKFTTGDRIKSDPLVVDNRVYISSYDGHLYALDASTGTTAWTFPAPPGGPTPPLEVGDFSYSSPVSADGVIYIGNLDHHLYAVKANDGTFLWRFKTVAPVTSTPLVTGDRVYFGSNDGNIYAINPSTQETVWKVTTQDWINSSARLVDGTLYIGANDRHVYAVDPKDGQVKWKFEAKGPVISVPQVYGGLLIFAGGSGDGAVYAVRLSDQTVFWKYQTDGKIESDPVIADDVLYVTCTDRRIYAFKLPPKS